MEKYYESMTRGAGGENEGAVSQSKQGKISPAPLAPNVRDMTLHRAVSGRKLEHHPAEMDQRKLCLLSCLLYRVQMGADLGIVKAHLLYIFIFYSYLTPTTLSISYSSISPIAGILFQPLSFLPLHFFTLFSRIFSVCLHLSPYSTPILSI